MALVATIGFFDGVHCGHQFVLENVVSIAASKHLTPAVVVFKDHPQRVLYGRSIPLLTTYDERLQLLKAFGVEQILTFSFEKICHLTAEEFMRLLHDEHDVSVLVMGYDHHFGSNHPDSFERYQESADRVGIELVRLPRNPISKASSTAIRKAISLGNIEEANDMLGYHFTLTGKVVSGKQIGRKIGFPTANLLIPEEKIVPMDGVYICETDDRKALLNIGSNPTLNGTERTIELHIPDFSGDLYGKTLSVQLLHYLRSEQLFDNLDALQHQIAQDVEQIKHNISAE